MDKQILNFTVNEQILVCENPIKISTNKVNYIQANFDLGENWSGFDSVRAVWFNDFNCISTVLDSLGNCVVPFEVMKRKGNVKVNLVGSISEDDVLTDRLTSYPVVAVIVDCTAQIVGSNTSPITPSEYEQFVAAVHEDAERAEAGATASEQSAQNAHTSEQNASQSATSAHNDKIAIEQAIAEVIQQIEDFEQVQVVVNTLPPSSQATSDFTNGVLTLGIPQGVKGDTGNGIQSIAKVGTSGLVDTYRITYTDGQTTTFTVTNGAKGDTGNGIQSIAKTSTVGLVDTYTITYTDGTTSTFTVTNGEKGDKGDQGEVSLSELEDATIVQTLSDTEPYNYRRTNNGNGAGHREYDEIVGASVGWNQLFCPKDNSTFTFNGVTVTVEDGKYTMSGTATSNGGRTKRWNKAGFEFDYVANHVYFYAVPTEMLLQSSSNAVVVTFYEGAGIKKNTRDTVTSAYLGRNVNNGTTYSKSGYITVVDLTLFNSQIADYVYSLEQSTAGSGVTWLKSHFPRLFDNGYQPFDSGSIKSVSGLTAHEMVGFNLWDEEWEVGTISYDGDSYSTVTLRSKNYIKAIPNTEYYFSGPNNKTKYVFFYDESKAWMSNIGITAPSTFTTPSGCHYMRFAYTYYIQDYTTYNHDICINLSDTSINGQYFPYEKHTYPLDSSVTLRGKYVLDNGQLKAVGDVWKSDGTVNVIHNITNMGNRTWAYSSADARFSNNTISDLKPFNSNNDVPNLLCAKYRTVSFSYFYGNPTVDKLISQSGAYIYIRDLAYTDATAFKNSLSGVELQYEKNTPTTEQATPYTNPQWCNSHGTEEYIGSELPVGHSTDYPMTLIDTADGLSNGTYEPRITVANGKKTVTWVSV